MKAQFKHYRPTDAKLSRDSVSKSCIQVYRNQSSYDDLSKLVQESEPVRSSVEMASKSRADLEPQNTEQKPAKAKTHDRGFSPVLFVK